MGLLETPTYHVAESSGDFLSQLFLSKEKHLEKKTADPSRALNEKGCAVCER